MNVLEVALDAICMAGQPNRNRMFDGQTQYRSADRNLIFDVQTECNSTAVRRNEKHLLRLPLPFFFLFSKEIDFCRYQFLSILYVGLLIQKFPHPAIDLSSTHTTLKKCRKK